MANRIARAIAFARIAIDRNSSIILFVAGSEVVSPRSDSTTPGGDERHPDVGIEFLAQVESHAPNTQMAVRPPSTASLAP